MIRKFLVGLTALSLTASGALAQRPVTALSVQSSTAAATTSEGAGGASILPPILAGVVIVFGVLLATETWPFEDDDEPVSP